MELIRAEDRYIPISIGASLLPGETIENNTSLMTRTLFEYRTKNPVPLTALSAELNYDSVAKIVSQKIAAAHLPFGVPVVLSISFRVNGQAGVEQRAVWIVLRVVA